MKPDYGLHLLSQGHSIEQAIYFYSFPVDHISFVDSQTFSIVNNLAVNGTEYAASFDFSSDLFRDVLALAPPQVVMDLQRGMQGRQVPFTVDLRTTFTMGIECRLGKLITVQRERFVPLEVSEVFAPR